ncbi:MAG: glycosyltransferase [Hydrogenophaga sp.]|uniref:glycosyltransferase family 2 protein n=1 Tax=Hydrogenophaga sp. TaxID=1904254 RepID=UPI001D43B6A5|nr:glycosyltransferase family 2 protein [Hydrogenophaga sp.]MBX3611677.1 glycosyltransferase [Hydrogenophaga sp.]
MRISVITVCFNSAATIDRALQSVAAQDWPEVEHIVIDGASRDDTMAVIERYRQHLAVVVSEPDKGIYDAMNKGLARATGEIVCFLNADDAYVAPDVLSQVAHEMSTHRLDALFADVAFFLPEAPERIVRRYRSDRFHPDRLAWGWMPAHPALFMRRSIYNQLGGFRTHFRIAGDFDFVARAFGPGQLRYRHLPKVLVRMQAGGVSNAGLRSKWRLNQEVLRSCRENGIRTNIFKILSKYPAKLMELVHP